VIRRRGAYVKQSSVLGSMVVTSMLKSDWIKGTLAGGGFMFLAMAALTAGPEFVSQRTAASIQQELRHIHLDQTATDSQNIDQSHLKLSSLSDGTDLLTDDLAVGDRLTIGGRDGVKSVLEIVSVKTASVQLPSNGAPVPSILKVVMARDVEVADRPLIRLIFDAGTQKSEPVKTLERPQSL
jgi:hypothetical protein